MELPEELREGFRRVLAGLPPGRLAPAVDRLIANYRGTVAKDAPLLRSRPDVAAYAAYRMPATYAAARFALDEFALLAPDFRPRTQVDVGGGTGAAAWAAAYAWPGLASTTVLDWSAPALELGRELAGWSAVPALRNAGWRRQAAGAGLELPAADLVTLSYVLGELDDRDRAGAVAAAAERAEVVAVVEPGTPAGFARLRQARDQLVSAGLRVVAPCPHSAACPITPDRDWCHFAVRLGRSALHRQVKGGSLAHEDEKFSYVVASRAPRQPAAGRVLRHPVLRKGMVTLQLCSAEEGLSRGVVTKRHRDLYRAARDVAWGESWPPAAD